MHLAPDFFRAAVAFVVVLGILVFVHEFGHYLAARWRGVHVEVFSIGFGQALATWTDRVGTVWKLAWIPLGGYVKLHGQERPQDVPPEVRARWLPGLTFQEKSVGSRAIVVAAGPAANFVLAMVLFAGLFAVAGRPVTAPVVNQVMSGSAAAVAGLQPQDRIVAIDGTPIANFEDLQRIVSAHPNTSMQVAIRRDGHDLTLPVVTGVQQQDGQQIGLLGIKGGQVTYQHVSLPAALWGGVAETWQVTAETARGVARIFTAGHGADEIGGPLRIAELSGQVAAMGAASLVSFIAVLSINLGLINLFPIPILDGGHLLFFAFEAIRGRPLPPRAQEYGFRAGLALLAGLFIFATWNDLAHLGMFRWFAG
ncbi:MAG TPA: RIP metalloprotease RseP [Acetobacteraceae bacterium]|nr:RIP metalloprotease RseP [Acetobacteraceae bacterium]